MSESRAFEPFAAAAEGGRIRTAAIAARPLSNRVVAMPSSIEIVLRGIPRSDELEAYIGEEVHKLDRVCDGVQTCRILAQAVRRPKQQGVQLAVGLSVTLPGTEIVVNREHGVDIRIALREAFKAAGLQLKDHARRADDAGRPRGADSGRNREA